MFKSLYGMLIVVMIAGILQGCITPVAQIKWYTEPGHIQPINCNPESPYCYN